MEWRTAVRTLPYCCYPVILSYHLHLLVFVCFAIAEELGLRFSQSLDLQLGLGQSLELKLSGMQRGC